jgi:S-formylglutathione hydrolase
LLRSSPQKLRALIDQGEADEFLESQLMPEALHEAAHAGGHDLMQRLHPGYDHSYFFIASFIADHIAWHAEALRQAPDVSS